MKRRSLLKAGVMGVAALALGSQSFGAREMEKLSRTKQKALLLSSSRYKDTDYLTHALPWLKEFVEKNNLSGKKVAFVPYARVDGRYDLYEARVANALKSLGLKIEGLHRSIPDEKILGADAIMVGGGNTFELVRQMHERGIMNLIARRVSEGVPYIGWSAGANVAGATMKTTNDMPIVQPKSFNTLNFFPHQINPHFISGKVAGHNGESREERLAEFLLANPKSVVYALPEGVALLIEGETLKVLGMNKYKSLLIFRKGMGRPQSIGIGSQLRFV